MADKQVDVKERIEVEECLKKIEQMESEKKSNEDIISLLSSTLEQVCPVDDIILEAAPLHFKLATALIDSIHERYNSEDENQEEDDGLIEDDMQIAWENLESARVLYTEAKDGNDYRKELANVYQKLGEIEMEKGDFESSEKNHEECLKLRRQVYPADSREIADSLFLCGITCFYLAQSHALLSVDEPSFEEKANEAAKKSLEWLENAQQTLFRCAVAKAKEEGILKEEETKGEVAAVAGMLKDRENLPESVKELLEVGFDISENIESAKKFSVKDVVEKEQNEVSKLRELMKDNLEDDEDDEDFEEEEEEEEEEEDEDTVIDVNALKRSHDEEEEEEEQNRKRKKM